METAAPMGLSVHRCCPHHTWRYMLLNFTRLLVVLIAHCPLLSGSTPHLVLSTRCHGFTFLYRLWSSGVCTAHLLRLGPQP